MSLNQEKIKAQAKKIMDEFMAELEKVPEIKEEFFVRRKENVREKETVAKDENFSELILKNAPKTKGGYILAEKKKW